MKIIGMDVGSTTVKAVVVENGHATWQDYQRHNTRQAEKVHEFLERVESEAGVVAGRDRIFFTGSGAGFIAPLCGGKLIQEVVAVAASVAIAPAVVVRATAGCARNWYHKKKCAREGESIRQIHGSPFIGTVTGFTERARLCAMGRDRKSRQSDSISVKRSLATTV